MENRITSIETNESFRTLGAPVPGVDAGQRADGYLAKKYPFWSRREWKQALQERRVYSEELPLRHTTRMRAGEQLYLFHPPESEPDVDDRIERVWEQDGVMAVYKPAGLPMHQVGSYHKNTFTTLVHERIGPEWSAVHRLDLETSGLVLCANSPEVRSKLTKIWAERKVQKTYVAIVRGVPKEREWICDAPIGDAEESEIRIKQWVNPAGQTAHTDFRVMDSKEDFSLIEAMPKTGRRNQIRIHAAYAGHVLVGDKLFYPDESVFQEYFAKGNTPEVIDRVGHPRLCLHASTLEFLHPVTEEKCLVTSAVPEDMQQFWDALGDA